jgi:hypothetical protein
MVRPSEVGRLEVSRLGRGGDSKESINTVPASCQQLFSEKGYDLPIDASSGRDLRTRLIVHTVSMELSESFVVGSGIVMSFRRQGVVKQCVASSRADSQDTIPGSLPYQPLIHTGLRQE